MGIKRQLDLRDAANKPCGNASNLNTDHELSQIRHDQGSLSTRCEQTTIKLEGPEMSRRRVDVNQGQGWDQREALALFLSQEVG